MFGKSAYAEFSLDEEGFTHRGKQYSFDDIAHIFFSRTTTTQRLNFVKVGVVDSSILKVFLKSGKKLNITVDEAGLFYWSNKDKTHELDYILKIYQLLCERTFKSRIAKYLSQLESLGYFVYDECAFNPSEQTITFRNKQFPISSTDLLRGAGYISLQRKNAGLADKIIREMVLTKSPQFNTQTDTDVIFSLLKHFFNVAW